VLRSQTTAGSSGLPDHFGEVLAAGVGDGEGVFVSDT